MDTAQEKKRTHAWEERIFEKPFSDTHISKFISVLHSVNKAGFIFDLTSHMKIGSRMNKFLSFRGAFNFGNSRALWVPNLSCFVVMPKNFLFSVLFVFIWWPFSLVLTVISWVSEFRSAHNLPMKQWHHLSSFYTSITTIHNYTQKNSFIKTRVYIFMDMQIWQLPIRNLKMPSWILIHGYTVLFPFRYCP